MDYWGFKSKQTTKGERTLMIFCTVQAVCLLPLLQTWVDLALLLGSMISNSDGSVHGTSVDRKAAHNSHLSPASERDIRASATIIQNHVLVNPVEMRGLFSSCQVFSWSASDL